MQGEASSLPLRGSRRGFFSSPIRGEGLCPIERPVDGRRTKRWGCLAAGVLLVVVSALQRPEVGVHRALF